MKDTVAISQSISDIRLLTRTENLNITEACKSILILDGSQRSALAATRSLGSMGLEVHVGAEHASSIAGSSRYCRTSFTYPDPATNAMAFADAIKDYVTKKGIGAVLPMTDLTIPIIADLRDSLDAIALCPTLEQYLAASDKFRLGKLAQQLGVPFPETVFVKPGDEIPEPLEALAYPVVVKPAFSKVAIGPRIVSTQVRTAANAAELRAIVEQSEWIGHCGYLLQAFVEGEGFGYFALCSDGEPIATFAHRRLKETPPSGGVSVLSESVVPDTRMEEASKKILRALRWDGVAMLEFKKRPGGKPFLMEINARFWGSLQLAIDSGVDFPALYFQSECGGEEVKMHPTAEVGKRLRWMLGDLDRTLQVLRSGGPEGRSRAILQFLKIWGGFRFEVLRPDDPKPFIAELRAWASARIRRLRK